MRFYKGAITYDNLNEMTIPEIIYYNEMANRIIEEEKKELDKSKRR